MKTRTSLLAVLAAAHIFPFAAQAQTEADAAPASEDVPIEAPAPANSGAIIRQATEAYNAGVAALNKNNLLEAARQFEKAIELAPTDAGAHMFLGYVRLSQKKYPDALASLEAAKKLGSLPAKLQPVLFNNLGIAYANSDRAGDALAAYQKALALSKEEYTDARFNLAFALLAQKKTKEALPHLKKLRDQRTTDKNFQGSIYDGLAEAYEAEEDWPQALGAYSEVIKYSPTDPTARFNFALSLSKAGRIDEAIVQAREVLKLRANHEPSLLLLGDLYSRKMNWAGAKDVLSRYVRANPDEFSAWFSLAVANDYAGDFDPALAAYAKAEAISPADPSVKNNIGRIYFKREKYPEAIAKLGEALELDKNFDDARVNLALVFAAQEKWDDANAQWTTYLDGIRDALQAPGVTAAEKTALKKRALSARGALAENYLKAAKYPNAAKEYRTILVEDPNNLDAMSNLGLALYHTGSLEEATKYYRDVIKRAPKNAIAWNNLGVVLEARELRVEAIAAYRQAIKLKPGYEEAIGNLKRLTIAT